MTNASENKRVFIVIPAYRAAETLPSVLKRLPQKVHDRVEKIVIVEDGGEGVPRSTSEAMLAPYPKTEVLYHPTNRGYGGAQKTGFRHAFDQGADVICLLHADGQYAPEIIEDLYSPLVSNDADVVLGSRMVHWRWALKGGMPVYKFIANICLTFLENICYGMWLSEYHSGYMLYSRKALETIPFEKLSDTFHFDGEMLLMSGKKNLRIREIAIPTHYGDEESHLKPIQYGIDVLKIIMRNFLGHYNSLETRS